jgi:hypothetical protein
LQDESRQQERQNLDQFFLFNDYLSGMEVCLSLLATLISNSRTTQRNGDQKRRAYLSG